MIRPRERCSWRRSQYPSFYKRLEWWDTREGKLPNPDVQYPSVPRAAAYVCTERTCSAPIFNAGRCFGQGQPSAWVYRRATRRCRSAATSGQ